MVNDLVSVIIPIFNVENYLRKCLESVRNQSYQNLEIILVNDGSQDSSGAICDEYCKKDSRVKCIHKKNGGLSDARNAGIEVATGEYLCFIDSDDSIHKQYVEILLRSLKKYDADIAVCNFQRVQENEITFEQEIDLSEICVNALNQDESWFALYDDKLKFQYTTVWSKLYKRYIFTALHFPVGRLNEDSATAHQIIGLIGKSIYVDAVLYYYLIRTGSIMNSNIKTDDGVKAIEDRISYFMSQGKQRLLEKTYCYYATMIMGTYCSLSGDEYDELRNSLVARLGTAYKEHKYIYNKHRKLLIRLNFFLIMPNVYRFLVRFIKNNIKRIG
ncbi:glycosyltransferase family 2 protein [Streptococcus suis]|uniref:Galactosyltransferase n=1 Tax=Streptococcus suis TaxID=1307 RepID=A0A0F6UYV5_STRSU|nr:glycosyltransferase family 2 protein [Streptococcus suis]AKE79107.1 galactosyltransferase [Streptococcus suis]AKE80735.1 galactosyltransferase [Streptococcus suis]AKE80757.1 galactosyltransferase [Streptococcus suis]AKE80779.1 galactosyltransferase [Streptococcus suis]AKE80801.1 galactosyltransferase [Streptococcus suis]